METSYFNLIVTIGLTGEQEEEEEEQQQQLGEKLAKCLSQNEARSLSLKMKVSGFR